MTAISSQITKACTKDTSIPLAVQAGRGMAASLLESRTSVPGPRPRSRNKYVVLFLLATLVTSHALPTQTLTAAWDTVASFVSSPALPSTRPTSTLSQEKRDPSTTISRPSASVPMPDMDPPVDSIEEQIALHGRPLPASTFVGSFEDGFEGWTSLEGAQEDSIVLVSSPVRTGNQSVRIRVRPGDYIQHGNRAEITHNLEDSPGTEGWYAWSLYIPRDYPTVADPTRQWQILCQWHDQPDLDAGQSWDAFPPHNSSIALYLLNYPENTSIGLGVGTNLPKGTWQYGPARVEKGEWIDILFHIGWSTGQDGFVNASVETGGLETRQTQVLTPLGG
ncbi:hypothetical protein Naga_100869g1, partial [Nannochloropsis gaditana]